MESEGKLFCEFLSLRTSKPAKSIAYWLYFIFVIVIIGILGSLITTYIEFLPHKEEITKMDSISYNLISFAIVLMCTSAIELIFINPTENDDEAKFSEISNGIVMTGVILIISSILFGLSIFLINFLSGVRLTISIFVCLLALYTWWITNARSLSVLKKPQQPTIAATTGGNPTGPLSGNTQGFTS
jgi:protein-S-isoprenylcysteine O-methyltransferase Ste14